MGKGYENPLLPHARIRQLFRAMLELRALISDSKALAQADIAVAVAAGLRDYELFSVFAPDPELHPALHRAQMPRRGAATARWLAALESKHSVPNRPGNPTG